MNDRKVYILPNPVTPNIPVQINEEICTGCNKCVEVCRTDVFMPNPEKGKPPMVLYPDECWYGGCCVAACPLHEQGAIRLIQPLRQRARWKRKETGEHFRIGMLNPPPPNTRLPVG